MTKNEFLQALKSSLSDLPKDELEERLSFYGEMIDDRTDEGKSEEDAVFEIGSVDEIASQIISDIPLVKIAKERLKPKRRLSGVEITLLVLGSPIWLSLLIAALAVIASLYVTLWSVIVALWSAFVALLCCALGCTASGIFFAANKNPLPGIATVSAGIICAGLSIFAFFGCRALTKGILNLTRKLALLIKHRFIKREVA